MESTHCGPATGPTVCNIEWIGFDAVTIAQPENSAQENYPHSIDLSRIRREYNIETVGRLLELDVKNHFAPCFRLENHPNGDSNPSLHFLERKNCAMCFRCDSRAMRNIDLVMAVLHCNLPGALKWFREQFGDLPTLRGRPAGLTQNKPFRVGIGGELEDLIRCGFYATLSEKAVRVLDVILHLRDTSGRASLSYPELLHFTGLASRSTIKAALDELIRYHIIERREASADASGFRPKSTFVPTLKNDDLQELIRHTYSKNRAAVAEEIEYHKQSKLARRRTRYQKQKKKSPEDERNAETLIS